MDISMIRRSDFSAITILYKWYDTLKMPFRFNIGLRYAREKEMVIFNRNSYFHREKKVDWVGQ